MRRNYFINHVAPLRYQTQYKRRKRCSKEFISACVLVVRKTIIQPTLAGLRIAGLYTHPKSPSRSIAADSFKSLLKKHSFGPHMVAYRTVLYVLYIKDPI